MSKMSEISIEIQNYLEQQVHPASIARILEIPLSWVYETLESMEAESEDFDPYNTVNS